MQVGCQLIVIGVLMYFVDFMILANGDPIYSLVKFGPLSLEKASYDGVAQPIGSSFSTN